MRVDAKDGDSFIPRSEVFDLVTLPRGASYEIVRAVGPFFTSTKITGIVQQIERYPKFNTVIALVTEVRVNEEGVLEEYSRGRFSTLVKRLFFEGTPRPAHYPLVPGVRP